MSISNEKRFVSVRNQRMAYVEQGSGPTVVLLHGNPTSSYLWRHVIPPLASRYRCIAPDLIGMGDSDKLAPSGPERYRFEEHQSFLDGLLEQVVPGGPVLLVVHDWGSALGFEWARRHPERVSGIAYTEAIVGVRQWEEFPPPAREFFQRLRTPLGEQMILDQNLFVEQLLPGSILRTLTPEEHAEYRRPFAEGGEGRRPMLSWPRQLPIAGEPKDICAMVERYATFLAQSLLPKLFINAEPGRLLTGALRERCRSWPNQREVTVRGLHYVQEDSPGEIAAAVLAFADEIC